MKKRSLLVGVVAPLAVASLIGAGFSTWYFTNGTYNKSDDVSVNIAPAVDNGSVDFDLDGLYLYLDQDAITYTTTADVAGTETFDVDFTYTVETSSDAASYAASEKPTGTATLSLDAALSTYVSLPEDTLDVTFDDGTVSGETIVYTGSFTLPELSYTASKPTSMEEYSSMVSALSGSTYSVIVDVTPANSYTGD